MLLRLMILKDIDWGYPYISDTQITDAVMIVRWIHRVPQGNETPLCALPNSKAEIQWAVTETNVCWCGNYMQLFVCYIQHKNWVSPAAWLTFCLKWSAFPQWGDQSDGAVWGLAWRWGWEVGMLGEKRSDGEWPIAATAVNCWSIFLESNSYAWNMYQYLDSLQKDSILEISFNLNKNGNSKQLKWGGTILDMEK